MKIALDVTTNRKLLKPSKNDVIIYDGHQWYITTREDIFNEYETRINFLIDALAQKTDELEADNRAFKEQVAQQMIEMSELIASLISAKGE